MATLTNTQISVTYVGLLKTSASTVLSSTAQQITDGSGNNSVLFLSTAGVGIGGAPSSGIEFEVTGNAKITGDLIVDNLTFDGSGITSSGALELDSASANDITLDSGGDIILDADGADVLLKDAGTHFGSITNSSTDLVISSIVADKDIIFKGLDDSSNITALTLDMSDAGKALFNSGATFGGSIGATGGAFTGSVTISHSSGDTLTLTKSTTEPSLRIEGDTDKDFVITVSGELLTFTQNDGATDILTLDHDTKAAVFGGTISATGSTLSGVLDVTATVSDAVFLRSSQATTTNVYITNTNATANNTANLYFAPANNIGGAYIRSTAIEDFSSSANRTADLRFAVRKDGTFSDALTIDSSGNATFAGKITGQDDGSVQLELKRTSSGTDGNTSIKFVQPLGDGYFGVNASGDLSFGTAANLITNNQFKVTRSGNATFGGNIEINSSSTASSGDIDKIIFKKAHTSGASSGFYDMGEIRSFTSNGFAGGLDFYFGKSTGGGNYASTFGMRLSETGLLGISANDPVKTLDVRGQLAISNNASSYWYIDREDSTGNFQIIDDGDNPALTIDTSRKVSVGSPVTGQLGVRGTTNDDSAFSFEAANSSGNSLFLVRNDGSVAIGTSTPHNDVSGLSISVASSTDQLYLERTGSGTGRYYLGAASNSFIIVDDAQSTERLRIDQNGVLQLTRTSSSGFVNANGTALELDVNRNPETGAFGDTNKSHARISLNGTNGGSIIKFSTASANNTVGTERMRIGSNGEITVTCGQSTIATFKSTGTGQNEKQLLIGTGGDRAILTAQTTAGATTAMAFNTGSAERMRITDDGSVSIGDSDNNGRLVRIKGSGDLLQLTSTNAGNAGAQLDLTHESASPADNDIVGLINFTGFDSGSNNTTYASIRCFATSVSSETGDIVFVNRTSSSSFTEKLRINSDGDILFGTTSDSNTHSYFSAESNSRMVLNLGSSTTSLSTIANFRDSTNGVVGNVQTNAGGVSFNSISDYRLKENIVEMTGALDRVSQLKPSQYNLKNHKENTVEGFIAHELQEVYPQAVSGEKDKVNDKGEPEYQFVDNSKLVPLLVGAIQELKKEIEILKNK